MKKSVLLILLVGFLTSYSQNNNNQTERNKNILKNAVEVVNSKNSAIPKYISFKKGNEPKIEEITSLLNSFSKSPFTLKEFNRSEDHIGYTHIKYQQIIKTIPVELSFITVHIKSGIIVAISANLESLSPNTASSAITETQGLNSALTHINAKKYKWQLPEEEAFIKKDLNDPEATFYPKGELTYLSVSGKLRLVYKFNIYAHEPVSRAEYYVDAVWGKIIFTNHIIKHANTLGVGNTGHSGSQVITTDSTSATNYRLRETGRGLGIETYDMNTGTNYGSAVDFTDNNNVWTSTTNDDQYALDAHWGAEMTYDYFWNVHARNSIDGAGFKLKSYIHYDNNYVNAFWDGNRMTYGDGNGTTTSPLTTMAIAGHEICHGLTTNTANLVYSYESGALNESFSDIFGVSIDFWSRPTQANWLMGDEIYISGGSYFRSMSNPNAKGDPDTYLGTSWYTGTGDNGGVHTNSGVQNFWFYLMVNGGSGTNDNGDAYSVAPMGFDTASRIAFRNLTVYLKRNSQYSDARFYAIKAATDLYGACSPAVIATTNAWHAVGVGRPYVAGVQSDFLTADSVGCKLPHTVSFTNASNNATAFIWDFGDGNTSTAVNPTHTYSIASGSGPFNVRLYANGGACGDDTLIKTANVRIDTSLSCPFILAANAIQSSAECNGTLYDDGGASGNYSASQTSYFTITPASGGGTTLFFSQFDVEAGTSTTSNCNFDYLEVYDGNSTAATLIGRYCNGNPPPASISSTGASLLIKFSTDRGLHLSGFKIDWTCEPVADFDVSPGDLCINKNITPVNKSGNSTTYAWSMPGAAPASSTLANPTFTYAASGTYSVRLIASNPSFSDTISKTYVITKNCITLLLPNDSIGESTCTGKLIDDGGFSGDYSPNQTSIVTISPVGTVNVVLTFNTFDVEADNCIYDYMMIYDGPNTVSPLIGKYCNSSLPPNPLISSGGALTVKFYADAGLELNGFDIDWHCSLVGLTEIEKINKINIYPNPSTNFLTIEVDFNQLNSLDVKIVDLLGKVHYKVNTVDKALQFTDKIDVSELASGTYIIYINNQPHKFVKQ